MKEVESAFLKLILDFNPRGSNSPNYSGFSNNLMTLLQCESLKEIDEMACVTPARPSRGQTPDARDSNTRIDYRRKLRIL